MMNSKTADCGCGQSVSGSAIPESKSPNVPTSPLGILRLSNIGEKIPKADVMVRIIRAMGASANSVIYSPQQETEGECGRLARLILQCTSMERKLIAAIIDTILDERHQEDTSKEEG